MTNTLPGEDARVEGLRALAAWMVVAMHYGGVWGAGPGSWVLQTGVNLFFVLSGFVFGRYVWGASLDPAVHALRRVTRIWPLYAVAVLLYALAAPAGTVSPDLLIKHLLFLHTWEDHATAGALNAAFWSLPPEVEFYVLLVLLAGARRPIVALFGLALLLRLALAEALPQAGVNAALRAWVHLPGVAVEFLAGALAWRWAQHPRPAALRWALGWLALLALGGLAWAMAAAGSEAALAQLPWARGKTGLWAALIYAVLVAAVLAGPQRLPARWAQVLLSAGALSYGVYLLHNLWPPLVRPHLPSALALLLCVGLTAGSAWAAHRWIEKPARLWGRRRAQAWSARAAGAAQAHE